jgi:hypothetical protein
VQSQGCIGPQGQRSQRDCDDENDGKKTLKSTDNDLWFMEGSIDLTGKNSVHSWQVRGVGLVATGVTNHLSGVAPGSLSKIAHDFTGDSDARTSCQGGGPESGDNAHPKESPQIWHCHHHTTNPVAPRSVPGRKSSRAPGTLNAGPWPETDPLADHTKEVCLGTGNILSRVVWTRSK